MIYCLSTYCRLKKIPPIQYPTNDLVRCDSIILVKFSVVHNYQEETTSSEDLSQTTDERIEHNSLIAFSLTVL